MLSVVDDYGFAELFKNGFEFNRIGRNGAVLNRVHVKDILRANALRLAHGLADLFSDEVETAVPSAITSRISPGITQVGLTRAIKDLKLSGGLRFSRFYACLRSLW